VDCFNGGACLSGTCCAFTSSSMAPSSRYNGTGYSVMDSGTTHCAACDNASRTSSYSTWFPETSIQYQCSACNPGHQIFDSNDYDGNGNFRCQPTCDPATEFRTSTFLGGSVCSKYTKKCGGTFTAASGSFTDGSAASATYGNNVNCRWVIRPQVGPCR
jgi:hypothetical protein